MATAATTTAAASSSLAPGEGKNTAGQPVAARFLGGRRDRRHDLVEGDRWRGLRPGVQPRGHARVEHLCRHAVRSRVAPMASAASIALRIACVA